MGSTTRWCPSKGSVDGLDDGHKHENKKNDNYDFDGDHDNNDNHCFDVNEDLQMGPTTCHMVCKEMGQASVIAT